MEDERLNRPCDVAFHAWRVDLYPRPNMNGGWQTGGPQSGGPSPYAIPPQAAEPGGEERAPEGRSLSIASFVVALLSLAFCPFFGPAAASGLAFLGAHKARGDRRSLPGLRNAAYVLSALGFLIWTIALVAAAVNGGGSGSQVVAVAPFTTTTSEVTTTEVTTAATTTTEATAAPSSPSTTSTARPNESTPPDPSTSTSTTASVQASGSASSLPPVVGGQVVAASASGADQVIAPQLVGVKLASANKTLKKVGLRLQAVDGVGHRKVRDKNHWIVLAQEVGPGAAARRGDVIRLTVRSVKDKRWPGQPPVAVPDLVGKTLKSAAKTIGKADLAKDVYDAWQPDHPRHVGNAKNWIVTTQEPAPGTALPHGGAVRIGIKHKSDHAPTTTIPTPPPPSATTAPQPALSVPTPAVTTPVLGFSDEALLSRLIVAPENDPGGYDRDSFGYPQGGTDSRGCNTRALVLMRDSTVPAQVDYPGCKVLAGRWTDRYTGQSYEDPGQVSIDHVVALKEAWRSGAASWPVDRKVAFGNDVKLVEALAVVGGSGNSSKGDKDPAAWKPPAQSYWHDYARRWLVVKVTWGLTADPAEVAALRSMLGSSGGGAPAAPLPAYSPPTTSTPSTQRTTTTRPPGPTTTPTTGSSSSVYYANCTDAWNAGAAPLHRGDPGYRSQLDRDGDGIACEQDPR